MKTRLTIAALLLAATAASAQNAFVLDNSFISVEGGINTMYVHSHGNGYEFVPAFGYDVSAGKWLTPSLGVRAGVMGGGLREYGAAAEIIRQKFGFVHADLLWNATNSILGYKADRLFSLIPYMQIGGIGLFMDDSYINAEIATGAGLLGTFRISDKLNANIDLRTLYYDACYTGNPMDHRVIVPSLLAGLSYNLGQTGWDYPEGALFDHSFVQAGYGAIKLRGREIVPTYQFAAGRWLSPTFGGRFAYQGAEDFRYAHGDFLWNVSNFIGGPAERIISVIPYASAGVVNTPASRFEFAAGGGLMGALRFSPRVGAYVDLQGLLVNGRATGYGRYGIGLSAIGGLQFNIGQTRWERETLGDERDRRESDVLNGMFATFGGGVNTLYAPAPAVELELGKWFTPYIGARIGYQGARIATHEPGDPTMRIGFAYAHADLLWNATNTIFGNVGQHFFSLSPYVHFGGLVEYLRANDKEFAAGAGLLGTFNVTDRAGFFVDFRTIAYKGIEHHTPVPERTLWASALAGLTYNLGEHDWYVPRGEFLENTFVGAGAGLNTTFQRGKAGLSYEAFAGKWFTPTMGGRIGFKGGNINCTGSSIREAYYHGDFMWDATASAFGADPDRIWQLAPYISLGLVQSYVDAPLCKEFAAGAGIYNRFRITDRVGFYVDASALLMNARIARQKFGRYPIDLSVTAGLAYNVGAGNWRNEAMSLERPWFTPRQTRYKGEWIISKRFIDNTFVTIAGGINSLWGPGMGAGFNGAAAPAMEITLGKWFNPTFAGRIGVQGINTAIYSSNAKPGVYEGIAPNGKSILETAFVYMHGDLLWNWNSAFAGWKPRVWEFIPYGSAGIIMSSPTETDIPGRRYRTDIAAGPGLINRFNIAERAALDIDIRTLFLGDQNFPSKELHNTILPSATIGFTYELGRPGWVSTTARFAPTLQNRMRDARGVVANTKFIDNTFVTASAGVHIALKGDCKGRGELIDISAGKWFNPIMAGRIGIQDCRFAGESALRCYHMDLIGDATNLFLGYDPDRIVSIQPFAMIGAVDEHIYSTPIKAGAGIIGNVKLDDRISLSAEARGIILNGSNVMGTVTFGMNYGIGAQDWKRASIQAEQPDSLRNAPKEWAISTNLVDYLDGTINLEAQYAVARHWTLDARVATNTHSYGKADMQDQKQFVALGARYWPWYTYSGWWFRADAQVQTYHTAGLPCKWCGIVEDASIPERGNAYGAGLSLGYSWMLTKWLNLDFSTGLWGGLKTFAQYTTPTFQTPTTTAYQTKAFYGVNNLTLGMMIVF